MCIFKKKSKEPNLFYEEDVFGRKNKTVVERDDVKLFEKTNDITIDNSFLVKKFKAEVHVLSKKEGGRGTPFFNGYRPQFYFGTTGIIGMIELEEGIQMVMPGDYCVMTVSLIEPAAIAPQQEFTIREGKKTVGSGVVLSIIE